MPEPTAELVLLEIRHAVAYQRARFPNTYPAINKAAEKLVSSTEFADFVEEALAPDGPFHEIDGERPNRTKPAETSPTEAADTSPLCENNLPDCGPGDCLTSDDVHLCERCYQGIAQEVCDHPSADGTGAPGEWKCTLCGARYRYEPDPDGPIRCGADGNFRRVMLDDEQPVSSAETLDLMAALKASLAAAGPKK